MAIARIRQQTDTDCLVCCIAMVLDQSRETVLSWLEGRDDGDVPTMVEVLAAKGYIVEEVDAIGKAGGVRRIVGMVNAKGEGHAVVVDEDNMSVVDPASVATTQKTILDYFNTGFHPQRVLVITKRD
jgi:hypothetical protein